MEESRTIMGRSSTRRPPVLPVRPRGISRAAVAGVIQNSVHTACGGGEERTVLNRVKKKKLKPDPVPAHKASGYVRGMGAIIALPKNKRGKMTVEDSVTKSSSGQIGGPAL